MEVKKLIEKRVLRGLSRGKIPSKYSARNLSRQERHSIVDCRLEKYQYLELLAKNKKTVGVPNPVEAKDGLHPSLKGRAGNL